MTFNWISEPTTEIEKRAISLLLESTGKSDPKTAILARSQMLLAQFGRTKPPFPSEALGYVQGIRKITKKDIPFDACLLPAQGNSYSVEVCKYHGRGRQNFSVAHEIAHTFLIEMEPSLRLPKRESDIGGFRKRNLVEKLCDVAAAELVWPMSVFFRDVWECGPSLESVVFLANTYGASLTGTARRFAETSLWKCCFIIWDYASHVEESHSQLEARAVFRSGSSSPVPKSKVAITSTSTPYLALTTNRIAKARDYMALGGEPQRYYVESLKLGNGDYGQVLSMVLLEPHAECIAFRRCRTDQLRLFS